MSSQAYKVPFDTSWDFHWFTRPMRFFTGTFTIFMAPAQGGNLGLLFADGKTPIATELIFPSLLPAPLPYGGRLNTRFRRGGLREALSFLEPGRH